MPDFDLGKRVRRLEKFVDNFEFAEEQHRQTLALRRIEAHQERISAQLERLDRKGTIMTAKVDAIKADVATLRTGVDTTGAEIVSSLNALADRIGGNPSEAELDDLATAVRATATEFEGKFGGLNEALDSLDPDVPGGSIPPEETPEG